MSGGMHRPLMPGENPMMPHMMQQQQQMMANGGMMAPHLGPPAAVPPYEMNPPRGPFVGPNPGYMVPGIFIAVAFSVFPSKSKLAY